MVTSAPNVLKSSTCTTKPAIRAAPRYISIQCGKFGWKLCQPLIYTETMKVGAESRLTNVSLQVPSKVNGGPVGDIIVTFPEGFATENAAVNEFTNNPRLRVKNSRPVKSIFVDVAGTAQAYPQNEPEVQTITISDTYSTQHIDLDPNPDTAIDIDEVQTLTLSEGLLRQTIEIQWPLAVCKSCSDTSKTTEVECLASGICTSENGMVGNGTQYYNLTLCENAADCGEHFDEKCKWTTIILG